MIGIRIPGISIFALGAGLSHVLILAAVLSVTITLPAADDRTARTVAVPVAVRTALPVPVTSAAASDQGVFSEVLLYGEGDTDALVLPPPIPIAAATFNLPVRIAVAEHPPQIGPVPVSRTVAGSPRSATLSPVAVPGAAPAVGTTLDILARLPDFMPDVVPRPLHKPALGSVRKKPPVAKKTSPSKKALPPKKTLSPKAKQRPKPPSRPVARSRTKPPAKPKFGGFLGGGPGRSMPEFPLPASR